MWKSYGKVFFDDSDCILPAVVQRKGVISTKLFKLDISSSFPKCEYSKLLVYQD
jgi:hypothetical protein